MNEINIYPVVAVFSSAQSKYIGCYAKVYNEDDDNWIMTRPYVYYQGQWYAIGGACRLKKALYTSDGKYLRTSDGRMMLLDDIM